MNDKFQQNFDIIKSTIQNNISTIRQLFEQAKNLREIIETLNGTEAEKKAQMETLIEDQYKSIETLVSQTNQLFELYNDFLKEASK